MRAHKAFLYPALIGGLLALPCASSACWQEAATRYRVPVDLLVAIARVESSLNPQAVNRSHQARTGSYDIGLMQINSAHLPQLKRWGIGEAQLMEPCTNIHVGAWILAQSIARHGLNWQAVGAYNAACTQLRGPACEAARARYASKVARALASESAGARP